MRELETKLSIVIDIDSLVYYIYYCIHIYMYIVYCRIRLINIFFAAREFLVSFLVS